MSGKRTHIDYLRDILDAVGKARRFAEGMEFEEFAADDRTSFAIVRALEIIGEAAKKVPRTVRDRYPDVPWQEMARIRDKLIHDYFGVDLRVVWRTVHEDLPPLSEQVTRVLNGLAGEESLAGGQHA